MKNTFVYPSKVETDSNNSLLLSGFYRLDLKDRNASVAPSFSPHLAYSSEFEFPVFNWSTSNKSSTTSQVLPILLGTGLKIFLQVKRLYVYCAELQ